MMVNNTYNNNNNNNDNNNDNNKNIIDLPFTILVYYFSPLPDAMYGIVASASTSKTSFMLVVFDSSITLCK